MSEFDETDRKMYGHLSHIVTHHALAIYEEGDFDSVSVLCTKRGVGTTLWFERTHGNVYAIRGQMSDSLKQSPEKMI